MKFVHADLTESQKDFEDDFVRQLQKSIRKIKKSREMEEKFMTLEELLEDERADAKAEGKAESVLDVLSEKGPISAALQQKIQSEKNPDVLKQWLKLAASVCSVREFENKM